jgi:hypothetical protein
MTNLTRKEINKRYRDKNRNKLLLANKSRYYSKLEEEKARSQTYRNINKDVIKERRKLRSKIERGTKPSFKLKANISRQIRRMLKKQTSSKCNESILKYLNYSMSDLKEHIQNQFESWMNWDNTGVYSKKIWNDDDEATWTWQIDHIIPQSLLPYSSMEDENFKKCWALENLRPLSAKQNFLDGIFRVRHKYVTM